MKIIKHEIFIYIEKDKKASYSESVGRLMDKINEWYEKKQNIDIISLNVDSVQLMPRVRGIQRCGEVYYTEEAIKDERQTHMHGRRSLG